MNNSDLNVTSKTSQSNRPLYSMSSEMTCGVIQYGGHTYLLDLYDRERIINFGKKFTFADESDIYPSYYCNYKKFTYIEFIFSLSPETVCYVFYNGNKRDLRRCNVKIHHKLHTQMTQNYNVTDYINGHHASVGQDANIMKNPIWKITENDKEYLLMYCEKDTICKLCEESYQKIIEFEQTANNGKKITWYRHANGYVLCSLNIYIHQIIMNCYGNGKGTKNISVDHIDRNPLNNSFENLRVATRKEQEQNTKGIAPDTKRERKQSAQCLPEGITQDIMKKYVCYYKDYADKDKTILREYFRVEQHPKLTTIWSTTKSCKVSILDKLVQANKVVDDLEHDIYPEKVGQPLPKYVSVVVARGKPHFVFEKRTEEKRLNLKMVLPDDYDLHEQLGFFNDKIKAKYEGETIF